MRILFITSGRSVDYQPDSLFHGLVSLGYDVTDSNRMWYMDDTITNSQRRNQWGKGFSIAGKLHGRTNIDRSRESIEGRIRDRYYDIVVYGSTWRFLDYFDAVTHCYPKNRIVFIDGEDGSQICGYCKPYGIYFKREMVRKEAGVFPISFALPRQQFVENPLGLKKDRDIATLIPGCRETYRYSTEKEYYDAYGSSRFAFTWKKRGWDCFRHYEIVAAGCLPFFTDVPHIPDMTMRTWPRDLQYRANYVALKWLSGTRDENVYSSTLSDFVEYGRESLNTEALASYFIDTVLNYK